jgi:membrane-bound lytic murein transglycosylase B
MGRVSHLDSAAAARADLERPGARVERFEYAPAELLLRLSVRLSVEPPGPARPLLLVECAAIERAYQPLLSCTGRAQMESADEWLWRGAFAVPPDIACDRGTLFSLRLRDDLRFALPTPSQRLIGVQESSQRDGNGQTWPSAIRRGALMSVVFCQLCMLPAGRPAAAMADASSGAGASGEPSPTGPPSTPPSGPAASAPSSSVPPAGGPTESATETVTEVVAGPSSKTISTSRVPSSASSAPQASTPAPRGALAPTRTAAPAVILRHTQKTSAADKTTGNTTAAHAEPGAGGPKVVRSAKNNVALPPEVLAAEAGALAAELASSAASSQALAFYRIPPFLLPIYQAAAARYAVPWQILAAINEVETNYGSDLSVSSAGAEGWMQFEPSSWLEYGVDALNAGYADPYNPVDAIFAAGRYLHAAGASTDLRQAILAYNHSEAYASSVLLRAKLISVFPRSAIGTLTGLIDAGLPVVGKQRVGKMLAPAASPSSTTAHAAFAHSTKAANRSGPATPGVSALSPTAAAAAAAGVTAQAPQVVDLLSARNAPAVAVQDGRIVELGSSRELGKYIVLRDVHGNVFTYAGLGSVSPSYAPSRTAAGSADRAGRGSRRARRLLALRVGSWVAKGTVLGHVQVPFGAKDGHLHFAIRPAGDPNTVDPRPILANWRQLNAALHPQGANGESNLLRATVSLKSSVAKVAHSARTLPTASRRLVLGGGLTTAQWDRLIARIAGLPVPTVAAKPSSAAIRDPQAGAK